LCVVLSTAVAAQVGPLRSPPSDIDAWVAKAMRTFDVPGVALAIVKDNDVVIAKGYGVRQLGESTAVDGNTLFGIASNTKVFTATALGLLVEEKKIEWDAPVIRYLPAFAMWDPYVTRELTVRDLLVHRSGLGLGAGDLLWWPASTYDRLDHYLGAPAFDWIDGYAKVRARREARDADAERRSASARDAASKPSLPLAKYAGTYRDAWYGDVTIADDGGRLVMTFSHTPTLSGNLELFQYDTFIVRWRDRELRADAYVTFALNPDGSIDQVKMRAVSPATDFSFDFQDLLLKPIR
jgi:CubicO group peptidase (beta-lactamase class C family)